VKGRWNHLEDAALKCAVKKMGGKRWKLVAERIPGRDHRQCFQRWVQIRNENVNKGPWSKEEDAQLQKAIPPNNARIRWNSVQEHVPSRTARQCRTRWVNNLCGRWKTDSWSTDEDAYLLKRCLEIGRKWANIGRGLNRSGLSVKSRYLHLERTKRCETGVESPATNIDSKILDIEELGDATCSPSEIESNGVYRKNIQCLENNIRKQMEEITNLKKRVSVLEKRKLTVAETVGRRKPEIIFNEPSFSNPTMAISGKLCPFDDISEWSRKSNCDGKCVECGIGAQLPAPPAGIISVNTTQSTDVFGEDSRRETSTNGLIRSDDCELADACDRSCNVSGICILDSIM